MTLDDFRATLIKLAPGKAAHVPYEIFEGLFPPGVEDDIARGQAYQFAKSCGCGIEHRANACEVLFIKPGS
jgi:hypothetical protein